MGKWRANHTATLLSSGNVLVVGSDGHGETPTCELYNPQTYAWSWGGAPLTGRVDHTATLLPSGKVLVTGGSASDLTTLMSAELYDPVTDSWAPTADMFAYRTLHTATLLPSGKVLVTGGRFYDPQFYTYWHLASTEMYDPEQGTWTRRLCMSTTRYGHTATLLPSGKVLVVGGGEYLASAEVYDPNTDTWAPAGNLSTGRTDHTATLLPSGEVLVAGGRRNATSDGTLASAEVYNPATNQWRTVPTPMRQARANHTATLLPSGQVLLARGDGPHYKTAELYDPATDGWIDAGQSPVLQDRQFHTATLLPSGQVLIAGGIGNYNGSTTQWGPLRSAELYVPPVVKRTVCVPLVLREH